MKTDIYDLILIVSEFVGTTISTTLSFILSVFGWFESFFYGSTLPEPKKVLITGPTNGLGLGLAKEYCRTASDLYLIGRDQQKLNNLKTLLATINKKCKVHLYCCDVNSEKFESTIKTIAESENIDMVIANAGVNRATSDNHNELIQYSKDIVGVNISGVFNTIFPFIAPMKERGFGQIVLVQGALGNGIYGGDPLYESSKNLIRTFGLDLREGMLKNNIHVNLINPGYMRTNMTKSNKSMFMCLEPEEVARRSHEQLVRDIPQINTPIPTYVLTTALGKLSVFGFSYLNAIKRLPSKLKSE